MDPIHPILPQPPNIQPVLPAPMVGHIGREAERKRGAESEEKRRRKSTADPNARATEPPTGPAAESATAAEAHGSHIDITA